ncbi:acyl carrier protein [Rhodoplanes elegans]|nr:acyl carrier protein [Rhodoplanes elegans]
MVHPKQTAADQVRAVLCSVVSYEPDEITDDRTLYSLHADELEVDEIAVRLEIEFGVRIGADAVSGDTTVAELIATVVGRLEAA